MDMIVNVTSAGAIELRDTTIISTFAAPIKVWPGCKCTWHISTKMFTSSFALFHESDITSPDITGTPPNLTLGADFGG